MNDRLTRIFAMTGKEFRQLARDRLTIGMVVGIPLIQLLMFGFAVNLDIRHLPGAVVDLSNTRASRELIAAVNASQVANLKIRARSVQELDALLKDGRVDVAIYIPSDFERRLLARDRPAAQLLVNGSDPSVTSVAAQLSALPLIAAPARAPPFEIRTYYNPERRSAVQIVPGLIGVILTMTMVLFTSIAIVRERERGNLELLIATPIKSQELMLGKILPYIGIGLIQVTVVLLAGRIIFTVPIRGNIFEVYVAAFIFICANLSLGLLISTLAKTQFQAVQLAVFTFLPSILLSGFMFPFEGMPQVAQWIAELLPLTHFVRLTRGILLRGASLVALWKDVAALCAFFAVMMVVAMKRFHKRLD